MNGNPNAPIVADDEMLNIRYLVEKQGTRLWQYMGLPNRQYDKTERRWKLLAPTTGRFCDWWRQMEGSNVLPIDSIRPIRYERAQLLKGGYYNQDPNTGRIDGTMVCHAIVVDELPRLPGAIRYALPDEVVVPAPVEFSGVSMDLPVI